MRTRFCLNTATIKQAPLEPQIQIASAVGFRRIGLWLDDIEAATRRGVSLFAIGDALNSAGLKVEEICFLGKWQETAEEDFPHVVQDTRQICEVSRALGCGLVVAVPAQRAGFLDRGPQRFRKICQTAADYGVRIALEFPGTAEEVKDLRTACQLVSAADCPNGGLLLDTFHFFLGGSKTLDLTKVSGEKIFLIHVSDAMNVSPEKLRTHHDYRTFPGEGTIDYGPIFEELERLGYEGAISLEIWNQQLLRANPMEVARKGFESLLPLEGLLNPESRASQRGL